MEGRGKLLKAMALEYVELLGDLGTVQKDVADLRAALLRGMRTGEGIEVSPNTVLTVTEKTPERKAVTQKLLREVGVEQALIDKLMRATKPHASAARVRTLKSVLLKDFMAAQERAEASGAGAAAEEESIFDEDQ